MKVKFKLFNVSRNGVKMSSEQTILGLDEVVDVSFSLPYDPHKDLRTALNNLGNYIHNKMNVKVPFTQITGYRISPCGNTDLITIYYSQKSIDNVSHNGESFCKCSKFSRQVITSINKKLNQVEAEICNYLRGKRDNRTVRQKNELSDKSNLKKQSKRS